MPRRLWSILSLLAWLAFLPGCVGSRNLCPRVIVPEEPVEIQATEKRDAYILVQDKRKQDSRLFGPYLPSDRGPLLGKPDNGMPDNGKPDSTKPETTAGKAKQEEPPVKNNDGPPLIRLDNGQPVAQGKAGKELDKDEPIVRALRAMIADRPNDALDILKHYDPATQELYIRLLPVLTMLHRKSLDKLSNQEIAAVNDQVVSLLLTLRPRTQLAIDKICFCKWIDGYGIYTPLPDGHGFNAPSPGKRGDEVHLYVQLRNFASELRNGLYETQLASSLELRAANADPGSKPIWYHNFADGKIPLRVRALLNDYFQHYVFPVPELPPGTYTLVLQIVDETRPGERRVARKAIDFRVNSVSARIP